VHDLSKCLIVEVQRRLAAYSELLIRSDGGDCRWKRLIMRSDGRRR
jgi:hypothetical protein